MPVLDVFSVVFPVFSTIAIGFLFAAIKKIDLSPILDILLYITIPALVISSLSQRSFYVSELTTVAFAVCAVVLGGGALTWIYLRLSGNTALKGLYLPTMFMNSGNMAFPLSLLAFGKEGLSVAILYYIAVSLLVYSIGVYIAKGKGGFTEIFRLPLIYAAAIALGLNLARIDLPTPVLITTEMLGMATLPIMQISLGYRLFSTKFRHVGPSFVGSVIRIGGGIAIAYGVVTLLGIEGTNKNVIILASAMPSAVINFVISHKYHLQSELVASVIATSTIISLITTPIVLMWLMNSH